LLKEVLRYLGRTKQMQKEADSYAKGLPLDGV